MWENLFWLSEEQFARLKPLLPDKVRGVSRVDDRRVISGIVHVLKSGCRLADAPLEYGPRKAHCRNRNAVERMFGRLKDFRRIAHVTTEEPIPSPQPSPSLQPSLIGYESGA